MGLQSVERGNLIIESSLKHLQIYHIFILLSLGEILDLCWDKNGSNMVQI